MLLIFFGSPHAVIADVPVQSVARDDFRNFSVIMGCDRQGCVCGDFLGLPHKPRQSLIDDPNGQTRHSQRAGFTTRSNSSNGTIVT